MTIKFTEELNALGNAEDDSGQEQKLNEYGEEVNKLWEKLMHLEVVIVDQIEVNCLDFYLNLIIYRNTNHFSF